MIPASCPLCIFYTPNLDPHAKPGQGYCHRHVPQPALLSTGMTLAYFPPVSPTDWCGEGEAGISNDTKAMGQNLIDKDKGNGHRH